MQATAGGSGSCTPGHRQILRPVHNAAASWLAVTDATEAVRNGAALLALVPSVFGPGQCSSTLIGRRLTAITGPGRHAAVKALRATGPALLVRSWSFGVRRDQLSQDAGIYRKVVYRKKPGLAALDLTG